MVKNPPANAGETAGSKLRDWLADGDKALLQFSILLVLGWPLPPFSTHKPYDPIPVRLWFDSHHLLTLSFPCVETVGPNHWCSILAGRWSHLGSFKRRWRWPCLWRVWYNRSGGEAQAQYFLKSSVIIRAATVENHWIKQSLRSLPVLMICEPWLGQVNEVETPLYCSEKTEYIIIISRSIQLNSRTSKKKNYKEFFSAFWKYPGSHYPLQLMVLKGLQASPWVFHFTDESRKSPEDNQVCLLAESVVESLAFLTILFSKCLLCRRNFWKVEMGGKPASLKEVFGSLVYPES